MKQLIRIPVFGFLPLLALLLMAASAPVSEPSSHPLKWDAMEKTIAAKADEKSAAFEFTVTNESDQPVEILDIQPSCGCTVAELPETPWRLAPGAKGTFKAVLDFQGKHGRIVKSLHVHSTGGSQRLAIVAEVEDTEEGRRLRNQQMAAVNRQGVFRGECASCHVLPTVGKSGAELFQTACGICHLATPRASMVPDLMMAREPRDAAYWRKWIAEGKEQTLMPGFAAARGGPLSEEQIESLVEFAVRNLPAGPAKE